MSKLIGAKLGDTAYLSVTDDGKLQYSLTGAADDFVEFETSGSGGESSGIKFYECKTYTPDADAYTKYSFTMSGAPIADANTTYERTKWVETPDTDSDYTTTAQWTASNGYKIIEESGYGEFSYYIKNASGTTVYSTDMPLSARATDYNTIPWVDMDMYESVTLTFSATQTEDVPATTEGWTGVLMQQDASTGSWSASATDPVNLTVQYLTPRVGDIYSEDTSIQVRRMFDGSTILIPKNGLVFYAPLQEDYIDQISGSSANVTSGTLTTFNGLSCLHLDNSSFARWLNNSNVPKDTEDYSLVILAAPTSLSGWNVLFGLGKSGDVQNSIRTQNGNLQSWGGTYLTTNVWQSVVLSRSNSVGKVYLNGNLNGSSTSSSVVNGSISSPADITVGAEYNGNDSTDGYFAFAAIYNRELTAEEVLEIHNTLMEGVVQ